MLARLLVGALALGAVVIALWQLAAATAPLRVERGVVEGVPVAVYRPADVAARPVVLVAHGFAGSQQLMQPFAATLARRGLIAVTFDFPGHGRNPAPLPGGIRDDAAASRALLGAMAAVEGFARALAGADGRVALLGHSMGGDIVVRHAVARGEAIAATVAVSAFVRRAEPGLPRNLLVVVGAWEPAALRAEGARAVAQSVPGGAAESVAEGTTYGRFEDGTARRLVASRGVEHIGVLYGADGLAAAAAWLGEALGVPGETTFVDARGPWIGLLALGLVALAWPLAALLPRAVPPLGVGAGGLGWRRLWPAVVVPAAATPLLLRLLPTPPLPLLLGDYMLAHFALYGALTAAGLWWAGAPAPWGTGRVAWPALALSAAAVGAYGILGIGLPLDAYVVSFMPVGPRWWLAAAMFAGTLPWFLADEWLARGQGAPRLLYAATKAAFLLSLAAAIALDLPRLFFLIIIVPVILVLFVGFGRFGAWAWRAAGHPFVAAVGNAAMLAWAIAVVFPLVAR